MTIRILARTALVAALALPFFAHAQAGAKPAAKQGPVASVNGVAIPAKRAEILLRERESKGESDNPQLRAAIRDDLINREVISQSATKSGFTKSAEMKVEIELMRQTVIVQAYIRDWLMKNPVSDADVQQEYERARAQTGSNEYKARHILLDSEDEARSVIAALQKGGNFEELAKKSKDSGSRERGGDLDWNVPSVFEQSFGDALTGLEKGKVSESPVKTRYGYHVIRLDDIRAVKFPPLADVKQRIQHQLAQQRIEEFVRELRAKATIK